MNSTEFALLLKSHDEEKARALLAERYSLSGLQKPFLVLHEDAADSSAGPASKKKFRPSRRQQRKSMACAQLQRFRETASRDYREYEPLNSLWNEYMRTVLAKANGVAAAQLVLAADWNGAFMRTVSCKNPACLTISGILVYETRSQYLVMTPQNGLKMLAKQGSVIALMHDGREFLIVGDRVVYRPAERTTRKFKPHRVNDIAGVLGGQLEHFREADHFNKA